MKRYRPGIDRLFWTISLPTVALMAVMTAMAALEPLALAITLPVDLLVLYLLLSPLFGYVELRCEGVYIRYGLVMRREIPYERIRGTERCRRWYSDSMTSLKMTLDHVNIKYNSFDVATVSVVDNDAFVRELDGILASRVER